VKPGYSIRKRAWNSSRWIEDLQEDVILVYRNPGPETFATSLVFKRGESVSLTAFPEIALAVDELLG
jgi:Uma2 family endonuclease